MSDGPRAPGTATEFAAERFQEQGRQLVHAFFGLFRSVKLYHPDNAVFAKPLEAARQIFNEILASQGQLRLQIVGTSIYLNGAPVKFELKSLESARNFVAELEQRKVGGVVLNGRLDVDQLKQFILIFGRGGGGGEEGEEMAGRKFGPIELLPWTTTKEKLQDEAEGRRVDPAKQTFVVYSRALFFMRKYFEARAARKPLPAAGASRLIEALVDLGKGQRKRLLTLATLKGAEEYHVFHAVNCALFSIALGFDLGLDRTQLRDLGMSGLFHDVGSFDLSLAEGGESKGPPGMPDPKVVAQSHLMSMRVAIAEGITSSAAFRVLATFETGADYGVAVRGPNGKIAGVTPKADLSLYSRILSICSVFDAFTTQRPFRAAHTREATLELMWTRLRNKFDPALLVAFTDMLLPGGAPWITDEERGNLNASLVDELPVPSA